MIANSRQQSDSSARELTRSVDQKLKQQTDLVTKGTVASQTTLADVKEIKLALARLEAVAQQQQQQAEGGDGVSWFLALAVYTSLLLSAVSLMMTMRARNRDFYKLG